MTIKSKGRGLKQDFFDNTAMGIPICTLLMRNFFATVPNALRETAIIDGANEWQVLTRIALPLCLPALAVLATLQFTWIWNDFLWPLIFTKSDEKRTIMLGIVNMKGNIRSPGACRARCP